MENYKYRVSLIIPVYNVEKYLRRCLDSLIVQTIDFDEMEILLINDGSKDGSLGICKEYANIYDNIKVFDKENEGVSKTRNFGLDKASGKYIMYLDSDDMLTESTIKTVLDFFDKHYDEVDVVTYPEKAYLPNGTTRPLHIRYKILNKTGIYDMKKLPFLFQVRLNIAVKNQFENNVKFDEDMGYHEDQKYCSEMLRDKLKLGFVNGCEYKYIIHDDSITGENTNPIALFEPTTKYWEELFASFNESVPQYYQSLFVHDMGWKLSQNCLLPYYLHGKEFETQCNRLWKLLERVDVDLIMKHPSLDGFHRFYFLEKKKNANITPVVMDDKFLLMHKNEALLKKNTMELIFNKLREKDGKILIQCTAKSQVFNFMGAPKVYVLENGTKKKALNPYLSPMSYYKCKTMVGRFYGFYYEFDLSEINSFKFIVELDGIEYGTHYYMMPTSPFVVCDEIIRGDYSIKFANNEFKVQNIGSERKKEIETHNNMLIKSHNGEAYNLRKISARYTNQNVWLYYDCKGVYSDNGYLQFIHDFDKEDGVKRYYVLNNDLDTCRELFEDRHLPYVVTFGSELHQNLFLRAKKIVTAFIEEVNIYPFDATNKKYYMDIMNQEIIYLQHGILHATLPWKYTPERIEIDKVLASSGFEVKNFHEKYCFRKEDIMPYGMPRFEMLDRNVKKKNRILFAPSWRMYLIGKCVNTVWQLTDDKFVASKYFIEFENFLNSKRLEKMLEENDLYIDFKIHPIFVPYLKHFNITNSRVSVAENHVEDEEYCMFITDFSSYVFNFAYLNSAIMYYVPDILEFEAGLNQYRELDLPFEEAFGDFAQTADEALDMLEKSIKNGFKMEEKYQKRIDEFFLDIENSTEKIYQYMIGNNK